MKVIAHRGDSGNYPENSMPAFLSAVESADCLEFDVRLSFDGQLIIVHDESLQRTHGIPKNVGSMSSEQLTKLDPPVPLLSDVLALGHPSIIELKSPSIESQVVDTLDELGVDLGCGYISVRNVSSVEVVREISNYPVGLMQKARSADEMNQLVEEFGIRIAQIRWKTYTDDQISELTRIATVNAFFADDPRGWSELLSLGVDGILTNYPMKLRNYLNINSSSSSP